MYSPPAENDSPEYDIIYFQRLLSNLVSETRLLSKASDWNADTAGGYRLCSMHRLYEVEDEGPSYLGTDRGSGNYPPPVKGRRPREEESKLNQLLLESNDLGPQPQYQLVVTMLMAGAVFGIILAFLLGKFVIQLFCLLLAFADSAVKSCAGPFRLHPCRILFRLKNGKSLTVLGSSLVTAGYSFFTWGFKTFRLLLLVAQQKGNHPLDQLLTVTATPRTPE